MPYFPGWALAPAFDRAEHDGQFVLDEVSPARALAAITVPVLLVHGESDREAAPAHSERVFRELRGPKEMIRVRGAGHVDVLRQEVWRQIVTWLQAALPTEVAGSVRR